MKCEAYFIGVYLNSFFNIESIPFKTPKPKYRRQKPYHAQYPQKGQKTERRFDFIGGGLYEAFDKHDRAASAGVNVILGSFG